MISGLATDPADLFGSPKRQRRERLIHRVLLGSTVFTLAVTVAILWSLFSEAIAFFVDVDLTKLWDIGWFPRRDIFDLKTLIVATLLTTVIAIAVAGPIGLAAAVYLSEYASPRVRRILKPVLEVLASIPSVVLGFFALQFISPTFVQNLFEARAQNLLAAGIGVGVLVIPLVASVSEDAMASVPRTLREASYGLGARKVTTTVRVVLPAAVSGLTAAFILAVSRAMGETMVVFIAGGGGDAALYTDDVREPGMTMTAAIASVASGTDNVAGSGLAFQSLFAVALLLFAITMALNVVANRFVRRAREVY